MFDQQVVDAKNAATVMIIYFNKKDCSKLNSSKIVWLHFQSIAKCLLWVSDCLLTLDSIELSLKSLNAAQIMTIVSFAWNHKKIHFQIGFWTQITDYNFLIEKITT